MLTPHLRSQFVTKILTSADGREYKVVFLLSLVNGEVKAQVISATLVEIDAKAQAAPLCLPLCKNSENFGEIPSAGKGTTPSPFFNTLFFFNSQPTRAPSA